MKLSKLWTKDFSMITLATILSVIGGEAMNLPISLLVFDQTKSTMMSAIIMACGMLPDVILPIFIAPLIDKGSKKKWIVGLDILMALIFLGTGFYILRNPFNYMFYVVFTLIIGTISVFYRLSYMAWYPDLIPLGMEQKGYAVSGTIYPTITIVMAPVSAFLYKNVPLGYIFMFVSLLIGTSVVAVMNITEVRSKVQEKYVFKQYKDDILEGFYYLKKEKGIRNIYAYMSITNGASNGTSMMTQAFYQTQPWLTVTMLGFLRSSETIGRVLGGLLQYKKVVPVKKRFALTKFVYTFYDSMDAFLLFMPYPLMLVNRFLCGAFGSTSATIRETAVQSYLPAEIRARINALFNVVFAIGGIFFQLVAGYLGQYLPFRTVAMILGLFTLCAMFIFIWIPGKENRPVYEAVRDDIIIENPAEATT